MTQNTQNKQTQESTTGGALRCSECNRSFNSEQEYREHMQTHEQGKAARAGVGSQQSTAGGRQESGNTERMNYAGQTGQRASGEGTSARDTSGESTTGQSGQTQNRQTHGQTSQAEKKQGYTSESNVGQGGAPGGQQPNQKTERFTPGTPSGQTERQPNPERGTERHQTGKSPGTSQPGNHPDFRDDRQAGTAVADRDDAENRQSRQQSDRQK